MNVKVAPLRLHHPPADKLAEHPPQCCVNTRHHRRQGQAQRPHSHIQMGCAGEGVVHAPAATAKRHSNQHFCVCLVLSSVSLHACVCRLACLPAGAHACLPVRLQPSGHLSAFAHVCMLVSLATTLQQRKPLTVCLVPPAPAAVQDGGDHAASRASPPCAPSWGPAWLLPWSWQAAAGVQKTATGPVGHAVQPKAQHDCMPLSPCCSVSS